MLYHNMHRVPVQVHCLDQYGHLGAFLLVWVHSVDLYEHQEGVTPAAGRPGRLSGGRESGYRLKINHHPFREFFIGREGVRKTPSEREDIGSP